VAQNIGIRDANHIIEEVLSTVASWPDTAKDCGVRPEHIEAISKTLLLYIYK
jgi:serine/threonine-protein kinase HipA